MKKLLRSALVECSHFKPTTHNAATAEQLEVREYHNRQTVKTRPQMPQPLVLSSRGLIIRELGAQAQAQIGRKKKEAAYQENLAPKSDVETLEVTPDSGYLGAAQYKYDPDTDRAPGGTRKADEREFTL
uniref:Uncharacterized protein n=1 Tax=Phytophthora ramorum TaxID=164328 RepID=H3GUE7_PHYRM